jgi:hypothetical protein
VSCFSTVVRDSPTWGSEFASDLIEGMQYVFFSGRLHLLLSEEFSVVAIDGTQPQYVLSAEGRDGAVEDGRACGSLADLASDRRGKWRIGGLAHER